jgi:acetyltransferase EpsM
MEKTKYLLFGAGGHAKVVHSVIDSLNGVVAHIIDQNIGLKEFGALKITHDFLVSDFKDQEAIITIGSNSIRKKIGESQAFSFGTLIHTTAIVDKSVAIGVGTVIVHRAVVQRDSSIGKHVIVNTAASIDHDCHIGDYVHIAPGSTLCGNVKVGEGVLIGAGATILPNITIGNWAVIGAGAVVTRDVPAYNTYVGIPAKNIKA